METTQNRKLHSFSVQNREKASLCGIEKVLSYGDDEICVLSSCGRITVSGKSLKIEKFDETEGTLCFSGSVDCIKYSTAKQPLLKRIFK